MRGYSDEGGAVAVGASAIAAEARRVSSAQPQLSTRRVSQVVTDSLTAAVDDAAEAEAVEQLVEEHRGEVIDGMLWRGGGDERDVAALDDSTRDGLLLVANVAKLHPLRGRLPRRIEADRRGFRTFDALSNRLTNDWRWRDLKGVHMSLSNAAAFDIEVPRGAMGGRAATRFNAMRFECEDAEVCEKVVGAIARFHHTDGVESSSLRLSANMS